MQNGRRSESSQDPAEGHDDVTPPERGFPGAMRIAPAVEPWSA